MDLFIAITAFLGCTTGILSFLWHIKTYNDNKRINYRYHAAFAGTVHPPARHEGLAFPMPRGGYECIILVIVNHGTHDLRISGIGIFGSATVDSDHDMYDIEAERQRRGKKYKDLSKSFPRPTDNPYIVHSGDSLEHSIYMNWTTLNKFDRRNWGICFTTGTGDRVRIDGHELNRDYRIKPLWLRQKFPYLFTLRDDARRDARNRLKKYDSVLNKKLPRPPTWSGYI